MNGAKEIIESFKAKTIDEKLNGLIFYLKRKSAYLGDEIPWDARIDHPITLFPNSNESVKIRDLAIKKGLISWKSRDSGLELTGEGWLMAESIEREIQMSKEEKRNRFLNKLNEKSKENVNEIVETMDIANELGLGRADAFNIVRYFSQKEMIRVRADQETIISITAKGIDEAERVNIKSSVRSTKHGDEIFVVHGHDNEMKESIARYLEKLVGPRIVILHERPNSGRTIIEKFEDFANVGYAVVLFSADDVGASKDKPTELQYRARQNVVFELGYFVRKLDRSKVCVIYREGVEILSDYKGVLYVTYDNSGKWKTDLAKEIEAAGIKIDPSVLIKS